MIGTAIILVNDATTVEIIIDETIVERYTPLIIFLLRFNFFNRFLVSSSFLLKYSLTFSEILCSSTILYILLFKYYYIYIASHYMNVRRNRLKGIYDRMRDRDMTSVDTYGN